MIVRSLRIIIFFCGESDCRSNLFRNFAAVIHIKPYYLTLMPDFKLLPMGIADFRRIRLENYYYVDKTVWKPDCFLLI